MERRTGAPKAKSSMTDDKPDANTEGGINAGSYIISVTHVSVETDLKPTTYNLKELEEIFYNTS